MIRSRFVLGPPADHRRWSAASNAYAVERMVKKGPSSRRIPPMQPGPSYQRPNPSPL